MLGRIQIKILAAVFVYVISASALAFEPHATPENFGTTPVLNDVQKWRVVFYEGGPHSNYYHYLEATILGLMKLGWIEKDDLDKIQSKNKDTRRLWNWLARDARSSAAGWGASGPMRISKGPGRLKLNPRSAVSTWKEERPRSSKMPSTAWMFSRFKIEPNRAKLSEIRTSRSS